MLARVAPVRPVKSSPAGSAQAAASGSPGARLGMTLYKLLALAICLACGLVFMMGRDGIEVLSEDKSQLLGVLVAMLGGYLFSISGYVRVLFNAPPEDESDIEDFKSSTKTGAFVGMAAMLSAFASGACVCDP